eukprot:gene34158-42118_t
MWARGHYLARRYPGEFAIQSALKPVKEGSKIPADGREPGLENLGSLVPLLDILNHNSDEDWLRLEVYSDALYVKCNHTMEKGSELFSNYGLLSNEKLLYAYGFATPSNPFDSIAVTLKAAVEPSAQVSSSSSFSTSSVKNLGVFHIEAGGINGVPQELWTMLSKLGGGDETHGDDKQSRKNNSGRGAGDSDSSDEETPEEAGIEVGVEECAILRDYLAGKRVAFERIMERSASILTKHGVTLNTYGTENEVSTSSNGADKVAVNLRALYIKWYLEGQFSILNETIEALQDLIEQSNDDDEEGEDGDERSSGEEESSSSGESSDEDGEGSEEGSGGEGDIDYGDVFADAPNSDEESV